MLINNYTIKSKRLNNKFLREQLSDDIIQKHK